MTNILTGTAFYTDLNGNLRFQLLISVSIPAHPFSWRSQLLIVQKHDNKQNGIYVIKAVKL